MPLPNEHSARVKPPGDFQEDSFRRKPIGESGVEAIMGHLKGETTMTIQTYRFPKDKFTPEEAKKWLADNEVKDYTFEAAAEEGVAEIKPDPEVKDKNLIAKAIDAVKGIFQHEKPEPGGFQFFKQADDSWRWFAWATNQFRDKDNPPEIFEAKAHKEFVTHLDAGGAMPEAWLWHTPGTKWGKADWVDYVDGFLCVSGLVDKGKESVAEALSKQRKLGVSHGFTCQYSDEKSGIIGWYRTFEISPLPADAAANPWTGMELVQQEAKEMFSDKKRKFLVDVIGEEGVVALEARTGDMAKEIAALGVEYKEGVDPMDTLADVIGKAVKAPTAIETAKAVIESEGFKAITSTIEAVRVNADQVPSILERLKALEKTEDEKIATAMMAKATPGTAPGYRASQEKETKVKEGDTISKSGPELPGGWKEMFGTIALGGVPKDSAKAS